MALSKSALVIIIIIITKMGAAREIERMREIMRKRKPASEREEEKQTYTGGGFGELER